MESSSGIGNNIDMANGHNSDYLRARTISNIMQQSSPSYQNSSIDNDNDAAGKIENQKQRSISIIPWAKILVGIILLSIIIFVIIDSLTTKYITTGFQTFLEWIETNLVAGVFAFMGVYFVATVCFIPGSILTLGSGFVFGKAVGLGPGVALATGAVFVGASLGAIASFLLGRYLLKDWVMEKLVQKYPTIKALDEAFKEQGLRIFVLLRLSPIVPFNAINYIGGVTSIRLWHYTLALIAILPGTILYCFIGATAGSLTESENAADGPVAIAAVVVGLVFGFLAVFAVSYYAKKEFNTIVAEQEQHNHEEEGNSSGAPEGEERQGSDMV